jgi:uncharacterized membrane protein
VTRNIALLATALWWGSLSTIGFVVVPLLFSHMPTKLMAGQMAAQLFHYQAFVSWACIGVLVVSAFVLAKKRNASLKLTEHSLLMAGLLFSLVIYFIVSPQITLRQNLRLWHSLGTALFAGQWICATVLLWRHNRVEQETLK